MKRSLLSILVVIITATLCQAQMAFDDDKVKSVLAVYKAAIKEYVDEVVNKEFRGSTNEELKRARYVDLMTQADLIAGEVRVAKQKDPKISKEILIRVIDNKYRNTYPGLAPEFFAKAHSEAEKI